MIFQRAYSQKAKHYLIEKIFILDRGEWDAPTECHDSCPLCDEMTSCDWASCSDDIGFMDFVINHVADYWCIDMHQMHLTGGFCRF